MRQFVETTSPGISSSLWTSCHLLLDTQEWRQFFEAGILDAILLFRASGLYPIDQLELSKEEFFVQWDLYLRALRSSAAIDDRPFRRVFSLYLTDDPTAVGVRRRSQGSNEGMVVPLKPCLVLQLHRMAFSETDPIRVLDGLFGPKTISWGVSLSCPQIAQDSDTKKVVRPLYGEMASLRAIWSAIRQFVREKTISVPVMTPQGRLWMPVRAGVEATKWLSDHQEFAARSPYRIDQQALLQAVQKRGGC